MCPRNVSVLLYITMISIFNLFLLIIVSESFVNCSNFGPKYPSTKGEVWPKPKSQVTELFYYKIYPRNFSIVVSGETCDILHRAVERYSFYMRMFHRMTTRLRDTNSDRIRRTDPNYKGQIKTLKIELFAPCEEYPYFGMDESYNLTVTKAAELKSSSIWGVLRGLETWTHLFYVQDDELGITINRTFIVDSPRYIHRGLLIDTSRHYLSLSTIQKTLDAMAMNKMNVLHWHIVDDQSFPYQSETFPELSLHGAYHKKLIYTKEDIKLIIEYARDRGIRILPEFDVPGHTASWGRAYPYLLTNCFRNGKIYDVGPMNPINNLTYKLLEELYSEIQELFPDKYIHIGGDEVDLDCWESNPVLQKYMKDNNLKSVNELHALFMKKVIPLLHEKSTPIVWQEVFDEGVSLPNNTLIQVWKGGDITEMVDILQQGHKLLYSSAWYLDHLQSGGDWESFYISDPRTIVSYWGHNLNLENIVGGEACMWGEVVNDMNFISRVWPRTCAVAEKLWSPEVPITHSVYNRIEEQTCRMNRRGIRAQPPSGPGFCFGADLAGSA